LNGIPITALIKAVMTPVITIAIIKNGSKYPNCIWAATWNKTALDIEDTIIAFL
tara:strand:- start:203 stop:364 length:162 start_codon:yes stop_codon:yes gene_type:complete